MAKRILDLRAYLIEHGASGGPDECWPWTGSIHKNGYGSALRKYAHRAAYEVFIGPIPRGLVIDHTCHNRDRACIGGASCQHRRCVNPAHLEAVTIAENQRRSGPERVRGWPDVWRAKTHCPQGHPYSGDNLIMQECRGRRPCRICRICAKDTSARHSAKRRKQR